MTEESTIVQRLWNYCNVLRDDGVSYGDYVEQLTYFLFLKMAHEQTLPPYSKPPRPFPRGWTGPASRRRMATTWNRTTARSWRAWATSPEC